MTGTIAGRQFSSTRERYDFYPTEPRWVHPLLRRIKFEGEILEPCAGDGAMAKVLQDAGYEVRASDIAPRAPWIQTADALQIQSAQNIVTNCPFRGTFEMVQHWLPITRGHVAVLTVVSFLESKKRGAFFQINPPHKIIMVAGRMDVFGKKSQFPHVWIVWKRGYQGPCFFEWSIP